jgi:hypothetical protein
MPQSVRGEIELLRASSARQVLRHLEIAEQINERHVGYQKAASHPNDR